MRTGSFVQRLRELGWTEGRTVATEYRWAEGRLAHTGEQGYSVMVAMAAEHRGELDKARCPTLCHKWLIPIRRKRYSIAGYVSQTVLPTLFGCVFADIVIVLVDVVDRRCWH
jgi:hypothetical protein